MLGLSPDPAFTNSWNISTGKNPPNEFLHSFLNLTLGAKDSPHLHNHMHIPRRSKTDFGEIPPAPLSFGGVSAPLVTQLPPPGFHGHQKKLQEDRWGVPLTNPTLPEMGGGVRGSDPLPPLLPNSGRPQFRTTKISSALRAVTRKK